MQVAASAPVSARRDDVPQEIIEHEKSIYTAQAKDSGRPEKFWDGIVQGRLKKFYKENVLTEQEFIKNPETTISQLADEVSKKADDKIEIVNFIRFNFGE